MLPNDICCWSSLSQSNYSNLAYLFHHEALDKSMLRLPVCCDKSWL